MHSDSNPPREQRGQSRGSFRGRGRGRGAFSPDRRPPRDSSTFRRPPIHLTFAPAEIKLNEGQAARIRELDEQIKAIGKPEEPSRADHERHMQDIENEITSLQSAKEQYQRQLDANEQEREAYFQGRDSVGDGTRLSYHTLNDLRRANDELTEEIRTLSQQRGQKMALLREMKLKAGVKDQNEALMKIDDIDSRIEAETLTVQQLKKALAEKDRLQSIFKCLPDMTALEQEV
jgi:Fic family protein